MGVHDYGSVLYNKEGEQCLVTLPDNEEELEDDDLLTFEELPNTLDFENDEDIEEELDMYLDEMGYGENKAYLLFKEGNKECFIQVDYSWDSWDFSIFDMFDFGYHESCDDMLPKWKMSKFKELKKLKLPKFRKIRSDVLKMKNPTIFNFTPREHQIYTSDKLWNISNEDLYHLSKCAELGNIKHKTRKEIFYLLKENISKYINGKD